MDTLFRFENNLYGDEFCEDVVEITDVEFWVDRLVQLPLFRPFCLEKATCLCCHYCSIDDFRVQFIEKSISVSPVLLYRVFYNGIIPFSEIFPFIMQKGCLYGVYYFRKLLPDFDAILDSKRHENDDDLFSGNESDLELMIEYGFVPNTMEYILKYDDIESLLSMDIQNRINEKAKWSPFEWSKKPNYLDFLAVSGYFGSIQCFKQLMLNGFIINHEVMSNVVCGGNSCLFHICFSETMNCSHLSLYASEYLRISLLQFLFEKNIDINAKNQNGMSSIFLASINGHIGIVDFLNEHNADVNITESNQQTPLHGGAKNGHLNIVDLLVKNGAIIGCLDDCKQTPIQIAVEFNRLKIVQLLLSKGQNINANNTENMITISIFHCYILQQARDILIL